MPIIIIREQNVDGYGGFADVCVQCDDPVTSEQMMELHHELVRLTKELKDSGTSDGSSGECFRGESPVHQLLFSRVLRRLPALLAG